MSRMDEETQDYLVSEICAALSQVLDDCPKPGYKPGVFAKVGVANGEELQKMMDKQLRTIFRLKPRAAEKEGVVTAFAPGMDVQPGQKKGDGEEEWSDSEPDEFGETEEDDFFMTEEDEDFSSDAPEENKLASTPIASGLPSGNGWSTPPLYQGGLTPVSLLPTTSFPPPPPSDPPTLTKKNPFKSTPGLSPSKMPRLERIRNPEPVDSDDWNSDGPSTSQRAPEPPAVPQRGRRASPGGSRPTRPGSPAPWKAPRPKLRAEPPAGLQRTISPQPYPRPGSPAPWSAPPPSVPHFVAPPSAAPPSLLSNVRRILGELPLEKDEFDSDDDDDVGPSPIVSIPHHHNLPRPTVPTHMTPLDLMIPNDENAPRATVVPTPPHPIGSPSPSVFSAMTLGTSPSSSVSHLGNNVSAGSTPFPSSPFSPFINMNLPPATIPPEYSADNDPDFDSD